MSDSTTISNGHTTMDSTYCVRPVLLSGGAGTRLWPLSRKHFPKQLQPLVSSRSMLQDTVVRARDTRDAARPVIVCDQEQRFLIAEQLREVGVEPHRIVLEPVGRNTAAALVTTALLLEEEEPQTVMLVLPTDHHISDIAAFHDAVARAETAAKHGWLTAFGVTPTRPDENYGYVECGAALPNGDGALRVRQFVEKPDPESAGAFIESGRHYWNSGIFLLPVRQFLEEVRKLQPDLLAACQWAIRQGVADLDFFRLDKAAFEAAPNVSIDKAIMELSDRVALVPVEMGWLDIDSWMSLHGALRDFGPSDESGNVLDGDIELEDVRNCHIRADGRLVAAVGVEDLTIVVTDDVVLVTKSDRTSGADKIVDRLGRRNRQEVLEHARVHRPWGSYQSVDGGDRFQVKRLIVNPGAELSLQMHHHRAEHWVVVHGTARVHCDGTERLLFENQSTYIPPGASHRLANTGVLPLHMIEVQSGSYLGEDDIVRLEDSYGRS